VVCGDKRQDVVYEDYRRVIFNSISFFCSIRLEMYVFKKVVLPIFCKTSVYFHVLSHDFVVCWL